MPRKRIQVREDAVQLKELEAGVAGTRHAQAIRMLRVLEEEPDRTLSECAAMLNRPERTVRRWWKIYQEDGIEALLQSAPAIRRGPSGLEAVALEAFRIHLRQYGFPELKDAQEWLVQEFGIRYSLARVSELVQTGEDRGQAPFDATAYPVRSDGSHTRSSGSFETTTTS